MDRAQIVTGVDEDDVLEELLEEERWERAERLRLAAEFSRPRGDASARNTPGATPPSTRPATHP